MFTSPRDTIETIVSHPHKGCPLWPSMGAEFAKFLLVGMGHVVLTLALYETFLFFMSYMRAFVLSALAGLVYMTFLTVIYTFNRKATVSNLLKQATWYIAYAGIYAAALTLLVNYCSMPAELAPIPLLLILTPMNFFCARWLSRGALRCLII